jgi:two-component system response regulator MprA
VVARLRALLRRAHAPESTEACVALDPSELTVSANGQSQPLTPTEFRLLAALARRTGRAVARAELVRTAWPHGAIVQDNTLDVYIARLRRKLRMLPEAPTIKTVHGVGYRLQ